MTVRVDGSSTVAIDAASPFPRHYLYDTHGDLIQKTGLIRYADWMGESMEADTPWGGINPIPLIVNVSSKPERDVADAALVSGRFTEHRLGVGALLSQHPIADTQAHILMDGILTIELDGQSVSEVGPGAIFDPSMRAPQSKERVTVRARTACRLGVIDRDYFESDALLAVAQQQSSRLETKLNSAPDERQLV